MGRQSGRAASAAKPAAASGRVPRALRRPSFPAAVVRVPVPDRDPTHGVRAMRCPFCKDNNDKVIDSPERECTSRTIGSMVMKELKKLDKVAYVRFASVYKNFESPEDFAEIAGEVIADAKEKPAKGRRAPKPAEDARRAPAAPPQEP